jgi:hypothetical protein
LAVDYFGRAPSEEFLSFARSRSDVVFVEDAVQAFDTGQRQWGTWRLHSPRKLVGVPDGGFVTPAGGVLQASVDRSEPSIDRYRAACLRFEDEAGLANAAWHAANQIREAGEASGCQRMTRLSFELLLRLPVEPISSRRKLNFIVLAELMEKFAFLPIEQPGFVPFGFPICVPSATRAEVRAALVVEGIFPAVHWSNLPSPGSFSAEHTLSTELLTLPCDHRYEPSDMERMAAIVLRAMGRR